MSNNPVFPTWTEERIVEKQVIARPTSYTDVAFYQGNDLRDPNLSEIRRMAPYAIGSKNYLGHTTGNLYEFVLDDARPAIDEYIDVTNELNLHGPNVLHAREEVGYETAEYIARQGRHVHWAHLSTASEAEYAAKLTKKYGQYFTAGVTPHHLTMTDRNADFQQGWNGARMQPPLAQEVDADALLYAYNKGDIQILETDHAPHTIDDKMKAETDNPEGEMDPECTTCFGVSGIEFVLPVMTALVRRKKITMERLVDSTYDQPMRMLGLRACQMTSKTTLLMGPYVIGEDDIVGKSRNTPYVGWTAGAKVVASDMMMRKPKVLGAQPRRAA